MNGEPRKPNGLVNGVHAVNGISNHSPRKRSRLEASDPSAVYDLVCVGFGPASLAIAVALHDALEAGTLRQSPKVLFLEKQSQFAWHAGMLLPGAKMQISFIKDLATLRDPRSNFTFLNYLHTQNRLVDFINLSTFLPARAEYEDYLCWCAGFFDDVVRYSNETLAVSRHEMTTGGQAVETFRVTSRDCKSGDVLTHRAKNVLLAVGGQPAIPRILPGGDPRVVHSSQYAHLIPSVLNDRNAPYRVAVLGAGQSAAEIFNNIQILYPNAKTWLIMRSEFLKPSDDSPFVNSIFNPEYINTLYPKSATYRQNLLADARSTNYGVVRLELIETLFERMYHQRRELGSDESKWPHRIMGGRQIVRTEAGTNTLRLIVEHAPTEEPANNMRQDTLPGEVGTQEILDVDLVISATGYQRRAHIDIIQDLWPLLPESTASVPNTPRQADSWEVQTKTLTAAGEARASSRVLEVARDYGVKFSPDSVASGSGIWLQGCCEGTHGLSDTLLSVLATRSGEIVDSIFGTQQSV